VRTSESTRQETAELRDRIRELETQLGEIQQLLKLRNAELARIQGAAAPGAEPPARPGAAKGEAPVSDRRLGGQRAGRRSVAAVETVRRPLGSGSGGSRR
jgi:Tfp pilus assembly protein FimV